MSGEDLKSKFLSLNEDSTDQEILDYFNEDWDSQVSEISTMTKRSPLEIRQLIDRP